MHQLQLRGLAGDNRDVPFSILRGRRMIDEVTIHPFDGITNLGLDLWW